VGIKKLHEIAKSQESSLNDMLQMFTIAESGSGELTFREKERPEIKMTIVDEEDKIQNMMSFVRSAQANTKKSLSRGDESASKKHATISLN